MNISDQIKNMLGIRRIDERIKGLRSSSFINTIGPQHGITFRNERYAELGDGYISCIYVSGYPQEPPLNWLDHITGIGEAIAVLDIATDNSDMVRMNLSRSMEEQESRITNAQNTKEAIDALALKEKLEGMYYEVSQMGAVVKLLNARIFLPCDDPYELNIRTQAVIKELSSAKFTSGVCLDEVKADWRAMFLPYHKANRSLYRRNGQPMLTDTLAGGNPFHFSSLMDPSGFYWGSTFVGSGGTVCWDMFHKTSRRLSYNLLVTGTMGSGKSTALKKLMLDRAVRGDKVRVFDVTGEFSDLAGYLGGKVISLDGSGNIINALEILPYSDNDETSYSAHISKVAAIYRFLNPEARKGHVLMLKRLLRKLYIEKEIVGRDGEFIRPLNTLCSDDFPIWSDLLRLIRREISSIEEKRSEEEFASYEDEEAGTGESITRFSAAQRQDLFSDLELDIDDICTNYGRLFDGRTFLEDVFSEQIVCFDLRSLLEMEPEVFDAQLFMALSLCWSNCVTGGSEMKRLFESGNIAFSDIQRFLIIIDEAHRIVNAGKLTGVKQLEVMEREGRKYFGGIAMASQSINDFFPEEADIAGISAIKNLFSFSTYKLMMRQDASCKKTIRSAFDGAFTESEIESIPKLEMGETVMSIAGDENITFRIDVAENELALFKGGA